MVMPANSSGTHIGYLAGRYPGSVGHLYSPGAQRGPWPFLPYALDNGAYPAHIAQKPFDFDAWRVLLNWARLQPQRPLWAAVPDVVEDRGGTLTAWGIYEHEVRRAGIRPAFVAQDGMSFEDVPTADCVVFLGGGDEWKDAAIGPWCRRFPGRVHVGRVNTADRLLRSYRAGAVSVDGSRWFQKNTRRRAGGGGGGQLAELVKFIEETHGQRSAA